MDHILVLHQIVAGVLQRVEAVVDLLLAGARHLVVRTLKHQPDLLQVGDHVIAQILGVVARRHREVAALDAVLEPDVRGAVLFHIVAGVPRGLDGVDLVEGALHGVLETHLVEDEELGLGGEIRHVGDAGGLQIGLGLGGDLTRVTRIRFVGQRVDDRERHVQGLVLAERIDVRGLDVRNELHVGLVDGLEAFHRGAVERHALVEGILEELARGHREVLLDADEIGETDGDVFHALLVDQRLGIGLGLDCSHWTAPFTWDGYEFQV